MAVVQTGFRDMYSAVGRAMGVAGLRMAEYPGSIPLEDLETVIEKALRTVAPAVIESFNSSAPVWINEGNLSKPEAVVCSGDLERVQDYFYTQGWTDGLPVIPPTHSHVREFLRHTPYEPFAILGQLPPERRGITPWNIAVNGVMAGCRPEHMPILVAIVEAILDPTFGVEHAGSTPSWEPLVIISGPVTKSMAFNSGAGALKVGNRANTSIGRFLRLYLRNGAGFRPETGTDKGSIGYTFNVALAEDDDAVRALGWAPLRVDQGFEEEDTTVTVTSLLGTAGPLYTYGDTPESHARIMANVAANTCGGWSGLGVLFKHWHPLLVLNPSVAKVLADHGWTKADVQDFLYRECKVTASSMDDVFRSVGLENVTLAGLVQEGEAPNLYAESGDPSRLVPALYRPEWLTIVIAGDAAKNQSRFYINNMVQGVPVTRRVKFP